MIDPVEDSKSGVPSPELLQIALKVGTEMARCGLDLLSANVAELRRLRSEKTSLD